MAVPFLATRETAKAALDSSLTARDDTHVDRALAAAGVAVAAQLHWAHIDPRLATRYFDWPNDQRARAWELWLDDNGLISLSSATAGGQTVTLLPEPVNTGPPYTRLETDLTGSTSLGAGSSHQRSVAVLGVWGVTYQTAPAGALAGAIASTSTPTVNVTDGSVVGVGSLLTCEVERMIVTGRGWLDSGQNLGADLAVLPSAQLVNLTSGAAFHVGETILIDAEEMLIVGIAGNGGVVRRAWNGSTLAAHTATADIYVPRALTVERAASGWTAATHADATPLTVWVPPPLCTALALAEFETQLLQEQSGYGRTVGAGENEREAAGRGLIHIRADAFAAHGRMRTGVIG